MDKCPECGAEQWPKFADGSEPISKYKCRSVEFEGKITHQSDRCKLNVAQQRIAELEQMIAEDCCSKTEANARIAKAQSEAAAMFNPELTRLREQLAADKPFTMLGRTALEMIRDVCEADVSGLSQTDGFIKVWEKLRAQLAAKDAEIERLRAKLRYIERSGDSENWIPVPDEG